MSGFFAEPMYGVRISGWPKDRMTPESLADPVASNGAKLELYPTDPRRELHDPPIGPTRVLYSSAREFSVMTCGNLTKGTAKPSLKINLEERSELLEKMDRLNLKSMWNDVSMMREALAWDLFARAAVPAPRHTYAKVLINDKYFGLYSVIEQIDKQFIKAHFGKNDEGNLYKAYWSDLGPATLERRVGRDGDDSGRQYFRDPLIDNRTYRLKTNEDEPENNTYDDLAALTRAITGPPRELEEILDVRGFLRWLSANVLLGSWDNYWATPANYYLYNSGKSGAQKKFMEQPYFHFLPWDYDNCLGLDFFGTAWQYADLVDITLATKNYNRGGRSSIPLATRVLGHVEYLRHYLDHLEHLLDTVFNTAAIIPKIGGLWERISTAAYLEADTPSGPPHTGRQFTNDQVYRCGLRQEELRHRGSKIEGIEHYVRMRHDQARAQLSELRTAHPRGSGA